MYVCVCDFVVHAQTILSFFSSWSYWWGWCQDGQWKSWDETPNFLVLVHLVAAPPHWPQENSDRPSSAANFSEQRLWVPARSRQPGV